MDLLFRFNKTFYNGKSTFLEVISEFLFLVIRGEANARIAWSAIENLHVGLKQVSGLMEHITSQLNDEALWLEKMESCFLQEYSTSQKLMDYYYRNDKVQFETKARLLYQALSIPGKSELVRERIVSLYNTRPHLPALKDEFRKAGII